MLNRNRHADNMIAIAIVLPTPSGKNNEIKCEYHCYSTFYLTELFDVLCDDGLDCRPVECVTSEACWLSVDDVIGGFTSTLLTTIAPLVLIALIKTIQSS